MKNIDSLCILLLILFSCSEQNEFVYPLIQTGEVTNIDSTGAIFHARISDLSTDNILEFGFVWGPASKQGLNPYRIILAETPANGTFSTKLATDLLSDTVYYVQAYAKNGSYTTYGKIVTFRSKGSLSPEIIDFSPKEGSDGTQVTINGRNFSPTLSGNIVKFGKATATVIEASNDRLVVTLPNELNVSGIVNLSVKSSNHIVYSGSTFFLHGCNIVDFAPANLMIGDTIYVQATDIGNGIADNTVSIGGSIAEIISISGNTLAAYVPYNPKLAFNEVALTVNGKTCYARDSVFLKNPWGKIDGITPFYRLNGSNGFSIGENGYAGFGMGNAAGPFKDLWEFDFVNNIWKLCADLPGLEREYPVAFSIGDKGYIGLGEDNFNANYNDLYEYDHINNTWLRKADFPGESRAAPFGLAIGNKAYVGLGMGWYISYKDFWEYDPGNDTWTELSDYPGSGIINLVGFSYGGKGYIGLGDSQDFWEYDPNSGSWHRLADFPGDIREGAVSFSIGRFGYIGLGVRPSDFVVLKDFWRYDIQNDKWTRIADIPFKGRVGAIGFTIGSKGMICSGTNYYNPYEVNSENFIVLSP